MKVTFLGTATSQGVPVIGCECEACTSVDTRDKRLRTSIMVEVDGNTFVVDIGPDFRQQMLRAQVTDIDAILITHEHNDHVAGLDDVRPLNFKWRRDMEVYAEERVNKNLRHRFAYAFSENPYPGVPQINLNNISKAASFDIKGTNITPVEVLHYKLPVLGFRFYDFTYLTDIKTIAAEELEKVKGTKTLVLSALRRTEHLSHLNIEEALELIEQIKPERAYLTHFSHRLGRQADVEPTLPDHVFMAYDGLVLDL